MSNLQVIENKGALVVDSRLVAKELWIEHETFMRTIKKYLTEIQEFGHLRFENGTVTNSVGAKNTVVFCYLNEEQATYVMTLSRNTDQVRACKRGLVQAFSDAKAKWELVKRDYPEVAEDIQAKLEMERLDRLIKLEELRYKNTQIACDMATMHGKQYALVAMGREDTIVEVDRPITEVIDKRCGDRRKGMTTKQLADYLKNKTGIRFKSGAEVERQLQRHAPELVDLVQRPVNQSFVNEENIERAIDVLSRNAPGRQLLLGE